MKKIRVESLEHLMDGTNENEVVLMAFCLCDQSVRDLRKIGIETDFIETIILNDKEYHRRDYLISHEHSKGIHGLRVLSDKDLPRGS